MTEPADRAAKAPQPPLTTRRPFLVSVLWLGGWIAVMWALAFVIPLTLSSESPPGRCSGLGFGCVMSPREQVRFLLGLLLSLTWPWAVVLVGVPWVAVWHKRWPAWVVGTTGFVASVGVVIIGLSIAGMIRF